MNLPVDLRDLEPTDQPLIAICTDPLAAKADYHEYVPPGTVITDWLNSCDILQTDEEFVFATVLNGNILDLEEFPDATLRPGDILTVVYTPGVIAIAPWVLWLSLSMSVVSVGLGIYTMLTRDMPSPGQEKKSSNYSIDYRGNRRRPDQVIPVQYGTMRQYPDLAGQYTTYIDQEQWMFQLFEITQGETDPIDETHIRYEDTPLTNFDNYQVEFVPPGSTSALYPNREFLSTDLDNVELTLAPTAGYAANPPGTDITSAVLDFVAPQGLYGVDKKQRITDHSVVVLIEYNNGGGWQPALQAYGTNRYRIPHNGNKPSRVSFSMDFLPGPGEYQFRVVRETGFFDSIDVQEAVVWDGLRGFIPSDSVTTTTRLAVKVQASQRLGNASLSKMNVVVARHIEDINSGWALTQTNSAVAAFADVITNQVYGAQRDRAVNLDIAALQALHTATGAAEFNGIFDDAMTAWDAASEIARTCMGQAIEMPGEIYTIIADEPIEPEDTPPVPIAMYTMRNVVKDSFAIEQVSVLTQSANYVKATYKDEEFDYIERTLEAVPSGIDPDPANGGKAYEINLRGFTNKDRAWKFAIRMANESRWRRKRVAFTTGLEGFVPQYGSVFLLDHYMLGLEMTNDSISGEVKSGSGGSLTVYEDLTSLQGVGGLQCYVVDSVGAPWGPASASVTGMHTLSVAGSPPLSFGVDHEGPKYSVGVGTDYIARVKCSKTHQVGEHQVRIEGFLDNSNVYIEDAAPTLPDIIPPQDAVPRVYDLKAEFFGDTGNPWVRLSWRGEFADYYKLEGSLDTQTTWDLIGKTTEEVYEFALPAVDEYVVGVRGVALVEGPRAYITLNPNGYVLGFPGAKNVRPLYPWVGDRCGIAWDPVNEGFGVYIAVNYAGKDQYVEIIADGRTTFEWSFWSAYIYGDTYEIDSQLAPVIGARTVTMRVYTADPVAQIWSTEFTTITQHNDQMDFAVNASWEERGTDLLLKWNYPEGSDGHGADVHYSTTTGFTPDVLGGTSRLWRGKGVETLIRGLLDSNEIYYVRLAVFDIWGATDDLQFSTEFVVTTTDDVVGGPIHWDDIIGKPPHLVNAPDLGLAPNQDTWGGPAAWGSVLMFAFDDDGQPEDTEGAVWIGTTKTIVDQRTFHVGGRDAPGAVDNGNAVDGYLLWDSQNRGTQFPIAGDNMAMAYWFAPGTWYIQDGRSGVYTVFTNQADTAIYSIGSCTFDGTNVTHAIVDQKVTTLNAIAFVLSHAMWDLINGDKKPEDFAEENRSSALAEPNKQTVGGGTVNGYILCRGEKPGLISTYPVKMPNQWVQISIPAGFACAFGVDASGVIVVDTLQSGRLPNGSGGFSQDWGCAYWFAPGAWYIQDGGSTPFLWADGNAGDTTYAVVGEWHTVGGIVQLSTMYAQTQTLAAKATEYSNALWEYVNGPGRPQDNAEVNRGSAVALRNQSSWSGGSDPGTFYVANSAGGVVTNDAVSFFHDGAPLVVPAGGGLARAVEASGSIALDTTLAGRFIGGYNFGAIYWFAPGVWYEQNGSAGVSTWAGAGDSSYVIVGEWEFAGGSMTQATLYSETRTVAQMQEVYSNALWSLVGDDGGRPENNATQGATWSSDIGGQPSDAVLLNNNQQWSDVGGVGIPDNNATVGAIWKGNISGQPADALIYNDQQTYDDVQGSKPPIDADVTIENLGADGNNRVPPAYQTFYSSEPPPWAGSPGVLVSGGLVGDSWLQTSSTTWLCDEIDDYPIGLPAGNYLVSCYARASSGTATFTFGIFNGSTYFASWDIGSSAYNAPTSQSVGTSPTFFVGQLQLGSTDRYSAYIQADPGTIRVDGLQIERMTGGQGIQDGHLNRYGGYGRFGVSTKDLVPEAAQRVAISSPAPGNYAIPTSGYAVIHSQIVSYTPGHQIMYRAKFKVNGTTRGGSFTAKLSADGNDFGDVILYVKADVAVDEQYELEFNAISTTTDIFTLQLQIAGDGQVPQFHVNNVGTFLEFIELLR